MPQPIREVVLDYIATTFDTRVAPLKLRSEFLTSSFESLLSHILDTDSPQSVPDVVKSLQIQLAFPNTTELLKHIDITIAREDIYEFWRRGQQTSPDTPFTEALILYLSNHLALEPQRVRTNISRITCALFALSSDSKLKLFPPIPASNASDDSTTALPPSSSELFMSEFYITLIAEATSKIDFTAALKQDANVESGGKGKAKRAAGGDKGGPKARKRKGKARIEDDELADTDDAHTVGSGQTPIREVGSIPVDPPPPYELHDPAGG